MKELACELNTRIDCFTILHRALQSCGRQSRLEQGAWSLGSLESKEFLIDPQEFLRIERGFETRKFELFLL